MERYEDYFDSTVELSFGDVRTRRASWATRCAASSSRRVGKSPKTVRLSACWSVRQPRSPLEKRLKDWKSDLGLSVHSAYGHSTAFRSDEMLIPLLATASQEEEKFGLTLSPRALLPKMRCGSREKKERFWRATCGANQQHAVTAARARSERKVGRGGSQHTASRRPRPGDTSPGLAPACQRQWNPLIELVQLVPRCTARAESRRSFRAGRGCKLGWFCRLH